MWEFKSVKPQRRRNPGTDSSAFKGLNSLPLFKVSMWQLGQGRSSACQPLNKNSSCSPTISGLLEARSAAVSEWCDRETISLCRFSTSAAHRLSCCSISCDAESWEFLFFMLEAILQQFALTNKKIHFFSILFKKKSISLLWLFWVEPFVSSWAFPYKFK